MQADAPPTNPVASTMDGNTTSLVSLPEPPPFWSRTVFGPSAIFTAMAIGSGELVFWPGLTLANGAGVLWIATLVVCLQYVLNTEIGRYSLATGESSVVGAGRLWRGWSWILLFGAVVPWLWPGWARAGCQLLGGALGLPEKPLSILSLLLCGLVLAAPQRVYALVERIQGLLLALIFVGIAVLCALAVNAGEETSSFWSSFLSGSGSVSFLTRVLDSRSGDFLALLSGIVFAGGGGILNLGYGILLCEKGFGMGAFASPITGLRHSFGLEHSRRTLEPLENDPATRNRWQAWLSLSRREHGLLFLGGNVLTIVLVALMFYSLMGNSPVASAGGFLQAATDRFGEVGGSLARALFVVVAFMIFFTSELGILDTTSRIAAGLLKSLFPHATTSSSAIYHGVLWFEITVGDRPYAGRSAPAFLVPRDQWCPEYHRNGDLRLPRSGP